MTPFCHLRLACSVLCLSSQNPFFLAEEFYHPGMELGGVETEQTEGTQIYRRRLGRARGWQS